MNHTDFNEILSKKLRESILNRVCETPTGYLKVPSDLIKRVRKETGITDPNWKVNSYIQNYVSMCSS